jgi:hypothetical protein
MISNRRTASAVGALFLVAMAASLLGGGMVQAVLSASEPIAAAAGNETLLVAGVLLELVNAVAVVGIGVLMFTVLRRHNETQAAGYLSLRIAEAVFCSLIVVSPLSLIGLGQAGADAVQLQAAGALSIAERASISGLLVPVFFNLGALLLYFSLYQSKLLSRFTPIWGLAAAVLILASNLPSTFGLEPGMGISMIFALPIILNEIFMGIWLVAKGFYPAAVSRLA